MVNRHVTNDIITGNLILCGVQYTSLFDFQCLWKAWELPGNVGYIIENWKSINKVLNFSISKRQQFEFNV